MRWGLQCRPRLTTLASTNSVGCWKTHALSIKVGDIVSGVVVHVSWRRDCYRLTVHSWCHVLLSTASNSWFKECWKSCQLLILGRRNTVFLCLQPTPSFFQSFFPIDQVFGDASWNSCLATYWSHKLPLTPSSWTCDPQTCSHQGRQRNKVRLRNPNYTYKRVSHQGNLKNV